IWVKDTFAGPQAAVSKLLTWNLMADQTLPVQAPGGSYSPTIVPIPDVATQGYQTALPSNGPVRSLQTGINRFQFIGQTWPAHPAQGINWELDLTPDGAQQFLIGNWGHNEQSGAEASQFQIANGRPFDERQHILRIQGTGAFTT